MEKYRERNISLEKFAEKNNHSTKKEE